MSASRTAFQQSSGLLAALLAGCAFHSATNAFPALSGVGQSSGQPVASAAHAAVALPARLQLTIRWPQGDRAGFKAQTLPLSTAAIVVSVSRSDGTLVASQTALPPAAGGPSTVSFNDLTAANNLSVMVQAYRNAGPPPSELIATGTAAGLNLVSSRVTQVSIGLHPVAVPTIAALSSNVGQPGDALTVTGTDLVAFDGASLSVDFDSVSGSSASAGVLSASSTSVQVKVPQGAASGPIVLYADGVPSAGSAAFWVPASVTLSVQDATPSWSPMGPGDFPVLIRQSVTLQSQTQWLLPVGLTDTGGLGQPPMPAFALTGAGTIGSAGQSVAGTLETATASFTATPSYATGSVEVSQGSLAASPIELTSDAVDQVAISPATLDLGAAAVPTASITAWNVMADGSTNSAVAFSVSDPASLSLSASLGQAVASVSDFASYGPVLVTAQSSLAPSQKASTTATLTTYQVMTLAGNGTYGLVDGSGAAAEFEQPSGLALDANGNLIVADYGAIRKVTPSGAVTTLAGNGSLGDVDGASSSAEFNELLGAAVEASGDILVADYNSHAIRDLSPSGRVSSLSVNSAGQAENLALSPSGQLYVNIQGGSPQIDLLSFADVLTPWLAGSAGDDTITQTLLTSTVLHPDCLTFDPSGVPYILGRANGYVYKVVGNQLVRVAGTYQGFNYPRTDGATGSATFNYPSDMAFDAAGNLYITDTETLSNSHGQTTISDAIRRISPAGWVSTIAGGSR
ncbi:MAG: hypothetical protein KGR26_03070, partial [Cyanobacteria bacterium REEB65]|nr:hypothetical protein [Cyanobacteria bacterium REEB65]